MKIFAIIVKDLKENKTTERPLPTTSEQKRDEKTKVLPESVKKIFPVDAKFADGSSKQQHLIEIVKPLSPLQKLRKATEAAESRLELEFKAAESKLELELKAAESKLELEFKVTESKLELAKAIEATKQDFSILELDLNVVKHSYDRQTYLFMKRTKDHLIAFATDSNPYFNSRIQEDGFGLIESAIDTASRGGIDLGYKLLEIIDNSQREKKQQTTGQTESKSMNGKTGSTVREQLLISSKSSKKSTLAEMWSSFCMFCCGGKESTEDTESQYQPPEISGESPQNIKM